ncbi:hypothetical protein PVAP13_3KG519501 [Panicum virgatum]|uniref:Transmembrane protein n=1 Tax=Panicum virgatum TaxID=38727 RepID=A0A8T0V765_PANVG|nr:hypothetical protein PVAP13_3KG519501 [Panicum virgatum]
MVPPSWNNFLRPLLRFVVVRSNHGERLVRISLFSELIKRKKKEARRKKKIVLVPTCLLSVCLCGLLFNCLHRFGIEI